jgi:hypothetical protein
MLRPHIDAAKARAAVSSIIDTQMIHEVFRDSGDTRVDENYLVLTVTIVGYAGDRNTAPEDVDGDYSVEVRWRVVAVDAAGVVDLVQALREQFVGQRLEVPGRACRPFDSEIEDARYDSNAALFYQDVYFDTVSSRAVT